MKNRAQLIAAILILFSFVFIVAFSIVKKEKQASKVVLENVRILYSGVDNPVLISIPGIDLADVDITIKNAAIRKDSANASRYYIRPGKGSKVYLEIKKHGGNKVISLDSFYVKDMANPAFYFGNNSGDCFMTHDEIKRPLGVFLRMNNCDFNLTFRIKSFSMSLYSRGKWIESTTDGPSFTEKQKDDLYKLQSGDRIIFHHITVKGHGGIDTTITRTIPGMFVTVQ